jgi:hypothetical protein
MNKFKGNSNETFTTTQDFKFDADVADKLVNDESKSFDVNGNPIKQRTKTHKDTTTLLSR